MNQDEFIDDIKEYFETYKKEVVQNSHNNIVYVNFDELAAFNVEVAENLINRPEEAIQLLEVCLEELPWAPNNARVRLTSISRGQSIFIADIRSKFLGKMIEIEGVVRQASEVRPLVTNAKFECPSCGTIISVLQIEKTFREPSRCSCGRRGGFKEVAKDMIDAQVLTIEECSDNLHGGEHPKRMTIFLKEDLVSRKMEKRTTPGSRIKIIGILQEVIITTRAGGKSTRCDLAIEANNVIPVDENFDDILISEEDEKQIRELSIHPQLLEKITESVAPSVCGHLNIKKALALQLFGGVPKHRRDKTRIRGDIHVLLVGDPGVAKSVMLEFVSKMAPKSRYVSGKSASGVGITAAAVKDEILKGWTLEAGAMVLANKGIVCVDEFDKMGDEDRSSMHQAMEQQTVTVTKATIQATLKSQTSVLAAANPKYGKFDPSQLISKQVNLEAPLLSRFDAIFIMRDIPNKDNDMAIGEHIFSEHMQEGSDDIIESDLLRKYISYSKQKINPIITPEAKNIMLDFYVELRDNPEAKNHINKSIPIGARQLEALIRLSEAHARMRLSEKVEVRDSEVAIELVKSYLMMVEVLGGATE